MKFLILISFTLILPNFCLAQTASPEGFFNGGYVDKSIDRSSVHPSIIQEGHTPKTIGKDRMKTLPIVGGEDHEKNGFVAPIFGEEKKEENGEDALEEEEEEEEEKTIPIERLALLINATKADETFRRIKIYGDVITKHDITPEAVYTMQIPQFIVRDPPNDWARVIIRGGSIEMNRDIIDQYKIEHLPTWIARTAEGDVVLEGYEDISRFLNIKGELRRKQLKRLGEELPEPVQGMKPLSPEEIQKQQQEQIKALTLKSEKMQEEMFEKLKESQFKVIEEQRKKLAEQQNVNLLEESD